MAKVLIVDDELNSVRMLSLIVSSMGHEPFGATSAAEATKVLSSLRPDIVLLDFMMPGMDGLETMELIRNLPAGKDVPVYLSTASDDRYLEHKMLNAGCTGVLPKPVQIELLEEILDKIDAALVPVMS
jgi:CheY-like chemotaxis protein